MNKPKINYFVDIGMAITFLAVAATGILKYPGLAKTLGVELTRRINTVHDRSGLLLTAFVLAHLILHYDWIICMTKNMFKKQEKCEK
ncbi:MAG: DUF4405 domain-containing protein [Candidatus Nanoarchaeia archaeon]